MFKGFCLLLTPIYFKHIYLEESFPFREYLPNLIFFKFIGKLGGLFEPPNRKKSREVTRPYQNTN